MPDRKKREENKLLVFPLSGKAIVSEAADLESVQAFPVGTWCYRVRAGTGWPCVSLL